MRCIFNLVFFLSALSINQLVVANPSDKEVLPVEAFANLPSISQVEISPDGKNIALLRRVHAKDVKGTALSVFDLESQTANHLVYTTNEKYVISWIQWANNNQILMSTVYPSTRFGIGTTETRLLKVDKDSPEPKNVYRNAFLKRLNYFPQFQDDIVDILPEDENHILVEFAGDDVYHSRVLKLGLEKGKTSIEQRSEKDVRRWVTDRQHRVRAAVKLKDTTYSILVRGIEEKSKWKTLWEFESFSENQIFPMGFDEDPNILYVSRYHDGRKAIFKINLQDELQENGESNMTLVFSDLNYDVNGRLLYSRKAKKVVGITYSTESGFTFWDEKYKAFQKALDKVLPDKDNIIIGMSDDENRYILFSTNDDDPGAYYVGDRKQGTLKLLAERYDQLPQEMMVEKKWISYRARDGLEIEAAMSLPGPEEAGPYPTIIHPHGGPISYDGNGFDYWTQFFVNRGYAVLQMNFRGSSGYGFDFMSAGLKGWGRQMQTDVEDGTRWMINEGIADPNRICMVGASYGGYASLMEAARNSDLYQCAVSFAGVTDLKYLVSSSYRYTNHKIVKEQIGSKGKELKLQSPINYAQDIDIPVLLVHGTKDRSVKVQHSRRMHKALLRAGKDSTYIEQKDGTHYLSNEDYRIQLFREMDAFLQKHLGNQNANDPDTLANQQ